MNDKPLDCFSRQTSKNKLESWRKQIDKLDEKIITTIAKRMSIVKRIGGYKKNQKISALDLKRWEEVVESRLSQAETLELSKDFIKVLLKLIHKYSLKIQK